MNRTKERKRIAKDPLHQKILDALAGHLDPEAFEACMGDLLQDDFPGLVPVPGGNDAGMDGAVASGQGEPFPLVCTTSEDVFGNLETSLDSFRERGLASRLVAFATSRTLTPGESRKLHGLAKQKDFTLLQVFERSAVANRLYRNSVWCKRLLGLVGTPSALSVVPLSRRPFVEIDLVGRAADVEWLRNTSGDRVIVGEPGSGKTYLFSWLIRNGWPALFLVSDNETEIANAIREQEPEIVIVDDAHAAPDELVRLRRLRQEIGAEFDIVASTWQGASNEVMEALGCPETQSRKLELLTRNELLEVIRQVGVEASDDVLRSLVDQSSNKPGLAVTIARLWLQGDWQKVLDGTVLSRTLLSLFRDLTGRKTTQVLASFSLGGVGGVSPAAVGEFLQEPPGEIQRIVTDLSAGGVLFVVDRFALAVKPEQLRSALLREVFFSGSPTALDYGRLLKLVPSYERAVEAIVLARLYEAAIESRELRDLVSGSKAPRLWRLFAAVSAEDAHWVLESYWGDLLDIAEALLCQIPQAAIPRILERAAERKGARDWGTGTLMGVLLTWVQDIEAGSQEWVHRRSMVARAAKDFLLNGGDPGTGVHGICIALSREFRGDRWDPGGTNITHVSGELPVESLREVAEIWAEVKDAIQELDATSWHHLSSTLLDWHLPTDGTSRPEISEQELEIRRFLVERVLRDLVPRAEGSPGLQTGLRRLAGKVGLTLEVGRDEALELLYPPLEAYRERQEPIDEALRRLAVEWAKELPQQVAKRIAFYEQESQRIGYGFIRNMSEFCGALADSVAAPEEWLDALLKENLRGELISPFLNRMVELRRDGWDQRLEDYLDGDLLMSSATSLILTLSDPLPTLLDHALDKVLDDPMLVEGLCIRKKVPLPTLRLILRLPFWETALAAATGEWCADPQGEVREEIRPEWRDAILRAKTWDYDGAEQNPGLEYWLETILAGDADLALDWLRTRLKDSDLPRYLMRDSPFARAVGALRKEQKESLLDELEPTRILQSLLPLLIGTDVELYRRLLAIGSLADYHLQPLGGLPSAAWEILAMAALDAHYTPESIAEATLAVPHTVFGSGKEYWERWDQAFAAFEGHPREDLREVARHGRRQARGSAQGPEWIQRQLDLHGLGAIAND